MVLNLSPLSAVIQDERRSLIVSSEETEDHHKLLYATNLPLSMLLWFIAIMFRG